MSLQRCIYFHINAHFSGHCAETKLRKTLFCVILKHEIMMQTRHVRPTETKQAKLVPFSNGSASEIAYHADKIHLSFQVHSM